MTRALGCSLVLFLSFAAAAQNADLTLSLTADPTYNAGEIATLRATVTNLGPDAAQAAGVRLTKPVAGSLPSASQFGCFDFSASILCNVPSLAAGASHEFTIPFLPPDDAGPLVLNARTEDFTFDPNPDNNSATASTTVVSLIDLTARLFVDSPFAVGRSSIARLVVSSKAARQPANPTALVTFDPNLEVRRVLGQCSLVSGTTYRCSLKGLGRMTNAGANFEVVPRNVEAAASITADLQTDETDWNPADNHASIAVPVYAVADLSVSVRTSPTLDAQNRGTATFVITNPDDVDANDASIDIAIYPATADASAPGGGWTCEALSPSFLRCTNPLIAKHSTSTFTLPMQFPQHEIHTAVKADLYQRVDTAVLFPTQSAIAHAIYYRDFLVTNTADSGTGSLRQAILDANAACSADDTTVPCAVRFAITEPVPADGWFTIAPLSPLPRITVTDFAIDGETQTAFSGDTNPLGPEVFLSGSFAGDADGLDLYTPSAVVRGLAIGGFARNAILLTTRPIATALHRQIIERDFLGLDPTGAAAAPNGLRGVTASRMVGEIRDNVIAGSGRSGITISDTSSVTITGNRIGVAAHSDAPVPNGASGIFVANGSHALIEDNVVENSHDFAIGILTATAEVLVNRITANGGPGIDRGLDGPTLQGAPMIMSTRFDSSTGDTIIEGLTSNVTSGIYTTTVYVYANATDQASGEQFLGSAIADANGRFELRYRGNIAGKYVDAMANIVTDFGDLVVRDATEFGSSVRAAGAYEPRRATRH